MDNGQKDNFAKENDINIYNHQITLENVLIEDIDFSFNFE